MRGSKALKKTPAFAVLLSIAAVSAGADEGKHWEAGAYSFSDERGGFRITGVSGKGTPGDPVVIEQEMESSSPVTLVIRAVKPLSPFGSADGSANGNLRLRLETLNNSGQAWVEFEFELQEILNQPSVFGDGMSFDQRRTDGQNITSNSFAAFDRNFEPYDRLRFIDGRVDPLRTGTFEFMITDFTPRSTFYLVQDPRIPSS